MCPIQFAFSAKWVGSRHRHPANRSFPPHSQICNDIRPFFPYTYRTMPIDDPLAIERKSGKSSDVLIFQLTGPVTLRNLFGLQDQLRSGEVPRAVILDLSGVPYMDSAGMGAIVNYYVFCQNRNVKLVIAGVSSRVMELFKMTRVDSVLTLAPTAETAEASL